MKRKKINAYNILTLQVILRKLKKMGIDVDYIDIASGRIHLNIPTLLYHFTYNIAPAETASAVREMVKRVGINKITWVESGESLKYTNRTVFSPEEIETALIRNCDKLEDMHIAISEVFEPIGIILNYINIKSKTADFKIPEYVITYNEEAKPESLADEAHKLLSGYGISDFSYTAKDQRLEAKIADPQQFIRTCNMFDANYEESGHLPTAVAKTCYDLQPGQWEDCDNSELDELKRRGKLVKSHFDSPGGSRWQPK